MAAAVLLLAGCGESSQDSNEPAGTYEVKVTEASFPAKQFLGQTSLLKLGVENTGSEAVPALTVTISVGGKLGAASGLPFGIHDPQKGLAAADRPVWVLAETYPRFAGSAKQGGATTSNRKTFAFGELQPGQTTSATWKLSAVRAGDYKLDYQVGAGLSEEVKAVASGGGAPAGSLPAVITRRLPETEVKDNGEIVEIGSAK